MNGIIWSLLETVFMEEKKDRPAMLVIEAWRNDALLKLKN